MMRLHFDAASLTTMAALISLPFFLFWYKKDREKEEKKGWGIRLFSLRELLEIVALALLCNGLLTIVMTGTVDFFHLSSKTQDELFQAAMPIQILGTVIICPVMEEVLFRGLVYQRLKAYNEGWFAVLIAAAFFAVYHGDAIQILFAFPMAIVIIGVYERFGTLLAPVLFHITVNLSSVLVNRWFMINS